MTTHSAPAALAAALLIAAGPAAADWPELTDPISVRPDEIAWSPAPPMLPEGAEIGILEGDLTREEPHTFMLRLPDGYHVAPV